MKSASAQRLAAVLLSLSAAPACAATPSAAPVAEVTAFPGAEGAGRYSLGGRGGAVLKVTNLDDAGPGSLRAAVEAKGPRTIVFAVAGTIALKTPLKISQGRVTLAGQTAPGGGITLRDQTLVVAADDVVNRFIRSRLGAESKTEGDAIWVAKGRRIILDHVSASWSVDETLSASARFDPPENGFYDLTVQWSIISESLAHSVHAKGDHGYGSLIRGGRGSKISFHHNLWPTMWRACRVPASSAPTSSTTGARAMPAMTPTRRRWSPTTSSTTPMSWAPTPRSPSPSTRNSLARAFFAGNSLNGEVPADPWSLVTGLEVEGYRQAAPIDIAPIVADPAASAYQRVLAETGASVARDAVDARVVAGVRDRTGRIINNEQDVGGWPELAAGEATVDTDGDGMPDAWEAAHGLNPNKPDGAAPARDGSGWTNLELYLADAAKVRG